MRPLIPFLERRRRVALEFMCRPTHLPDKQRVASRDGEKDDPFDRCQGLAERAAKRRPGSARLPHGKRWYAQAIQPRRPLHARSRSEMAREARPASIRRIVSRRPHVRSGGQDVDQSSLYCRAARPVHWRGRAQRAGLSRVARNVLALRRPAISKPSTKRPYTGVRISRASSAVVGERASERD